MQPCCDVLIFFSSFDQTSLVWCIKSRTRLFIKLPSIVKFSKYLRQNVPYKTEIWYAWLHEQYFSKHHFLDTCQCAFKNNFFTQNLRATVSALKNFWSPSSGETWRKNSDQIYVTLFKGPMPFSDTLPKGVTNCKHFFLLFFFLSCFTKVLLVFMKNTFD